MTDPTNFADAEAIHDWLTTDFDDDRPTRAEAMRCDAEHGRHVYDPSTGCWT